MKPPGYWETPGLIAEIEPVVKKIAAAASEGLTSDGGMIYEKNLTTGHIDGDYHWWVQAETVVGYYNLFRYFGDRGAFATFHRLLGVY